MAEQFGPYLLEEVIGRGGMGVVYRAYDSGRDRTVALKRLPKELAADENFQARFRRESRLAARLNEPHIIPIHDFGEIDGQLYLDMRLVEGMDLSKLIAAEGGSLEPSLAVDVIAQVASALSAAHNAGLMHRDIKPSNVLVTGITVEDRSSPFAYLVDFGIARAILGTEGTALTTTTDWFGTVAYMAPERISGSSGDSRSDIYSLACLLYQTVTGAAPFTGEALQVLFAHVNSAPPSATAANAAVPAGLDAVIRRGMAKNPDDRYQTASQLTAAARSSVTRPGRAPAAPAPTTRPVPPGPRHAGPPQSFPPVAGPPNSYPPRTGPGASGPPPAGPPNSFPPRSGPPNSIPPRSGPPNSIPPRSGPPNSIPPRSGPGQRPNQGGPGRPDQNRPNQNRPNQNRPNQISGPMPPRRAAPPARNNRALWILIAIAVVVVLAAAIAVIVSVSGGGGSSGAQGSPTASGSGSPRTSAPGSSGSTGSGPSSGSSTGGSVGTWSEFANFTKLVGTSADDRTGAFKGATCTLTAPASSVPGMVDQIECTDLTGTKAQIDVARFRSKSDIDSLVSSLEIASFTKTTWKVADEGRGLLVSSPAKFSGGPTLFTTFCGFPTYLVGFNADTDTGLAVADLQKLWDAATVPNDTPPPCG